VRVRESGKQAVTWRRLRLYVIDLSLIERDTSSCHLLLMLLTDSLNLRANNNLTWQQDSTALVSLSTSCVGRRCDALGPASIACLWRYGHRPWKRGDSREVSIMWDWIWCHSCIILSKQVDVYRYYSHRLAEHQPSRAD